MFMGNKDEFKFGQELIRRKLLTEAQFRTVADYQKSLGGTIREIIVKLGFVRAEVLQEVLAHHQGMPTVDPTQRRLDPRLTEKIPRSLLEKHRMVPFPHDGRENAILLAVAQPVDPQVIEEIQTLTGMSVETALAPEAAVRLILSQLSEVPKPPPPPADSRADLAPDAESILQALIRVLVSKGVLTREEITREVERLVTKSTAS